MSETVQDSVRVDELDLAIVDCLQLNPRAPWTLVGKALAVDPVTVARRWQRLTSTGTAWVTGRAAGHAGPEAGLAVIELSCTAGRTWPIAERVAQLPHVLSIEHMSGPRALSLLVEVRDLAFLSQFLLRSLGPIRGVIETRSHAVTRVHRMGDVWQLQMLDRHQRAIMTSQLGQHTVKPGGAGGARGPYDEIDRRLILLLGEDGRMPVVDLAVRLGLSEGAVRRRLGELVRSSRVILRCDVALPASSWSVITWVWCQAPVDDPDTIAAIMRHAKGVRVCFQVAGGQPNVLLALNAPSLQETAAMEAALAAAAPRLTILDRSMVLRSVKRMGRELDAAGRSIRTVPMDIWADPD